MIFPILFLLGMAFIGMLGVVITFTWNSFIVPFLNMPISNNISIQVGLVISLILVSLYFIFFTKNFESKKFKEFLGKK